MTAKEVLARAASLVSDDLEVAEPDEAAAAVARVLRLAGEPARYVNGSQLAGLLGVRRQAVQQRAARGRLLVRADEVGVLYPLWQFRDGKPVDGLAALIAAAHAVGLDDAALIEWIEAEPTRIEQLHAGRAVDLIDSLPSARVQVRHHRRSPKPAPSLRD